ncbi:MAG TPA: SPOR domain-containing protein [Chitinophagales bacterium]|nr:SPOR domain-containing protein [Chitinophagales bacterium]
MSTFKTIFLSFILLFTYASVQAQQDPNNLFLVDVENIYNTSMAGKKLDNQYVGNRSMGAEEVLMYEVLNSKWENGKWLRYTANPNGKGTIKVGHPFLNKNKNRLFFVSNISGGAGGFDVYYSEKINGQWTDPTNLGLKVNSPADEMFPFITDAGVLQVFRNSTQLNFDLEEIISPTTQLDKANSTIVQQEIKKETIIVESQKDTKVPQQVNEIAVPKVEAKQTVEKKSEVEYRIQLGAFSKPNWDVLRQVEDLGQLKTMPTSTGLTSVHLGAFSSLEAAQRVAGIVKNRPGFGNAYVVSVKDEQVIGIHR